MRCARRASVSGEPSKLAALMRQAHNAVCKILRALAVWGECSSGPSLLATLRLRRSERFFLAAGDFFYLRAVPIWGSKNELAQRLLRISVLNEMAMAGLTVVWLDIGPRRSLSELRRALTWQPSQCHLELIIGRVDDDAAAFVWLALWAKKVSSSLILAEGGQLDSLPLKEEKLLRELLGNAGSALLWFTGSAL